MVEKEPQKSIISSLRDWGVLIALVSPIVAFFSIISLWGTIPRRIETNEALLQRHEIALNAQNTQMAVMQNDISYIKDKVKKL